MTTHSKIYTASLLAFVLLAAACSDFLDKEQISDFSADGFYKTKDDARAGVYGIYNALQSALKTNFAFWGEGRADAVATHHASDPLALIQNNLTESMSSASWDNLYTVISRANYAIKYIPDVYDGDSGGDALIGQARALRALAYFYAVRVWGDVPLITEPYTSVEQDIFTEKTDRETVLKLIEEDLIFAADYCAASYSGEDARVLFTQGGANALLTHVYMWRQEYDKALITSEKVLNNSLYSLVAMKDWSSIFTAGYTHESIFEIGYNETQTNGLRVLYALGSDAEYFPSDLFKASFEDDDARQPLIYDLTAATPKMIWKYFGEDFNDESADASDQNIVLLRLADIMLLRAEALHQTDATVEALTLLNTIRQRAGLDALTEASATTQYGSVADAILHERAIELCYEGHRWFDLVRTNQAIATMNPINGLSDTQNLVWPISELALNANPNLIQNDFYR